MRRQTLFLFPSALMVEGRGERSTVRRQKLFLLPSALIVDRDVNALPTTPGGSVDALDVIDPSTALGGSVEARDGTGETDGDAGDVDTAVTGDAVTSLP